MAGAVDAETREAARACVVAVTDRFGASILNEARRFEAAAADAFGPDHRKERVALCNAVRVGIPKALLADSSEHVTRAMALAELADRLADETAMDAAMARWAVEALADVMGVEAERLPAVDPARVTTTDAEPALHGIEIDLRRRSRRTIVIAVIIVTVVGALGGAAWVWSTGWNPFVVP